MMLTLQPFPLAWLLGWLDLKPLWEPFLPLLGQSLLFAKIMSERPVFRFLSKQNVLLHHFSFVLVQQDCQVQNVENWRRNAPHPHRRTVAQPLLNQPQIDARFQQVCRPRMAQGMNRGRLLNAALPDRLLHWSLDTAGFRRLLHRSPTLLWRRSTGK